MDNNMLREMLKNQRHYKVRSKNKDPEFLAGMIYNALSYPGNVMKIDVSVIAAPFTYLICCNHKTPHTKEEFIKEYVNSKEHAFINLVGALDKEDTRRININILFDSRDGSLLKDVIDEFPEDVVGILSTPRFVPTKREETEIMNFLNWLEGYEG